MLASSLPLNPLPSALDSAPRGRGNPALAGRRPLWRPLSQANQSLNPLFLVRDRTHRTGNPAWMPCVPARHANWQREEKVSRKERNGLARPLYDEQGPASPICTVHPDGRTPFAAYPSRGQRPQEDTERRKMPPTEAIAKDRRKIRAAIFVFMSIIMRCAIYA